jgi:hypothetical protein
MKTAAKKPIDISSIGASISLKVVSDVERYDFHGTVSMGSNYAITASGTPVDGMTVELWFWTTITPGANTFTILGTVINPKTIAGHFVALCRYNGDLSVWMVAAAAVPKEPDGVGITTDANGNLIIKPLGITDAMISETAAITLSKLAALSFSQLVGTDGAGHFVSLDTATYPSPNELKFLKGVGSALQTQLDAITTDLTTNFTNNTDLATLLSDYALTTAVASAISSALSAYTDTSGMNIAIAAALGTRPLPVQNAVLSGATVLNSSAKDQYTVDTSGGTVQVTLPKASDFVDGHVITIAFFGTNSAGSTIITQDSNVIYDILGATPASITGMASGSWYDIMGNHGSGAAGKWRVIRGVTI